MRIFFYILVMALTTYLIRALPFVIFKKQITHPFIRSFLFYVPYAVLAAMTFPAILDATASLSSALIALGVALLCSFFGMGLLPVALLSCLSVFLCELFF